MNKITINDESLTLDTRKRVCELTNLGICDLKIFEINDFKYQTVQQRPCLSPTFKPEIYVSAWKITDQGAEEIAFRGLNSNSMTIGSTVQLAIEALENLLGRKVAV